MSEFATLSQTLLSGLSDADSDAAQGTAEMAKGN